MGHIKVTLEIKVSQLSQFATNKFDINAALTLVSRHTNERDKMQTSETIINIYQAISGMQQEIQFIRKTAENPYFDSKYADLNGHIVEIKPLLKKYNLILIQGGHQMPDFSWALRTKLIHSSGEWIETDTPMLSEKKNMAAQGSSITYARRQGLGPLFLMGAVDDDGKATIDTGAEEDAEKAIAESIQNQVEKQKEFRKVTPQEVKSFIDKMIEWKVDFDKIKLLLKGSFGVDKTIELNAKQIIDLQAIVQKNLNNYLKVEGTK